MRIFLAGNPGGWNGPAAALIPEIKNRLDSFAYPSGAEGFLSLASPGVHMIMDSGAFTAHQTGRVITKESYLAFAQEFMARHGERLAWLRFMTLDVIGDQEKTWQNTAFLRERGLPVVPILTYGASHYDVERAFEHPYVACGALTQHSLDPEALGAWFNWIFRLASEHADATGRLPRLHMLGITQDWALRRYPMYSCDSTSWMTPLVYGAKHYERQTGLMILPKWKDLPAPSIVALRNRLQRIRRKEADTTRLWQHRGITFEDD